MDENTLKAVIAAGGVLLGAVVAGLASAFSATQKIRALQLECAQRIQENYLANARSYTYAIYVPLSICLEKLRLAFDIFVRGLDESRSVDKKVDDQLRAAIDEYLKTVQEMIERGADAFLTTALDEKLRSFNGFLAASRTATTNERRITIGYRLSLPGSVSFSRSGRFTKTVRGVAATIGNVAEISAGLNGIGISYEAKELVAAPINSPDFERRILEDIPSLKLLVKEVTLGVQS